MRTTCFGQKHWNDMCTTDWPTSTLKGKSDRISCIQCIPKKHPPVTLRHQHWSCHTRFCGYHVGTQFFSFQPSPDMFASGLPELGFSSRVKACGMRDTSMQQNVEKRHGTTRYDTHGNRMVPCAMVRQRKKDIGWVLCTLLTLLTLWLRFNLPSSISRRLHTLGIHCDFKQRSSGRLKHHETVAPSLLPGLDFYAISLWNSAFRLWKRQMSEHH